MSKINTLLLASLLSLSVNTFAATVATSAQSVVASAQGVAQKAAKNPLSVHVLNLQTGIPSEGVKVTLERKEGEKWVNLSSGVTNSQGRISGLYPEEKNLEPGDYKVTFATGEYFKAQNLDTLFPEIPVLIHIEKTDEHYHVPLLLSQYGYSTYRGS